MPRLINLARDPLLYKPADGVHVDSVAALHGAPKSQRNLASFKLVVWRDRDLSCIRPPNKALDSCGSATSDRSVADHSPTGLQDADVLRL